MLHFFFDIDDTLYNQQEIFAKAVEEVFPEHADLPMRELFLRRSQYTNDQFANTDYDEDALKDMQIFRMKQAMADFGISISDEESWEFQQAYVNQQKDLKLNAGMQDLLEALTKWKVPISVLSNGVHANQVRKIKQLGLDRWIPEEYWFTSERMGYAKPNPQIFKAVEEELGIRPNQAVYIGDNYETDVIVAKAAGWESIWFNPRRQPLADTQIQPIRNIYTSDQLVAVCDRLLLDHDIAQRQAAAHAADQ